MCPEKLAKSIPYEKVKIRGHIKGQNHEAKQFSKRFCHGSMENTLSNLNNWFTYHSVIHPIELKGIFCISKLHQRKVCKAYVLGQVQGKKRYVRGKVGKEGVRIH